MTFRVPTRRRPARVLLVPVLCCSLVLAGSPGLLAGTPQSVDLDARAFTHWSGDVYRLEMTGSRTVGGEATLSFSLDSAPVDPARFGRSAPALEPDLPVDELTFQRTAELAVDDAGGFAPVRHWDAVASMTLSVSTSGVVADYSIGQDALTLSLPAGAAGPGQSLPPAVVTLNGFTVEIDVETLEKLGTAMREGSDISGIPLPNAIEDLAERFVDRDGFMRSSLLLHTIVAHSRDHFAPGRSCFLPCLGCAGTGVGYLAAWIGLIAACTTVPLTSGFSALLCVGAFLGLTAAQIGVLATCASCLICLTPDPPCECKGEPFCDCD